LNPSDFGADIFDPNDDQPAPRAAAPKQEADAPSAEAQAEVSEPDAGDDGEAKPTRKKARKKAPARRRKAEPAEAEPAAADSGTDSSAEVTAAVAAEGTDAEAGAQAAAAPADVEEAPPAEPEGERRTRRRRRRRDGESRPEESSADSTEQTTEAASPDEAAIAEDAQDADSDPDSPEGEAEDRADADDERGGRRRRRRRRRGGRGDEDAAEAPAKTESDDEVRAGTEPRRPLRRSDRMIPVPTPGGERHGQRVAVLVDLAALLDQARESGGELAFGKLVQHLARRRHLIRAIAYASPELLVEVGSALRGSDLDVHAIASPSDLPVALAVDAMSLASRVDCVVLAPGVDHLAPLAAALRAHGVRIETASFTEASGMADDLAAARHPLGAESLFVP
jgi:uncharacterized LabA/DUF88 family protein